LDRKIDIGNNKVNYVRKFLVTRKIDNQKGPPPPPCGRGDSVYFHATKKRRLKTNKQAIKVTIDPCRCVPGKPLTKKP